MNFKLAINGMDALREQLANFSARRLNATVATAMTRTAVKVRADLQAKLSSTFDQPTRYTERALRYIAATADKPVAAVGFNIEAVTDVQGNVLRYQQAQPGETPAAKYLQVQVDGGARKDKRFERALRFAGVLPAGWQAVPGQRAKLDAYGNHSAGEIRQILSYFDAAEAVLGSTQNMGMAGRTKRRNGTRRSAGWELFIVRAGDRREWVRAGGGRGTHRMQPGIYRRTFMGLGTRIEPLVIFVRSIRYAAKYPFDAQARESGERHLLREMDRAITEQLSRASQAGVQQSFGGF